MRYCCAYMEDRLSSNDVYLVYNLKFREYGIKCSDGGNAVILFQYCPWCATKLPPSLRDKWFDIMRNEYRLEDPGADKRKIPKEFKTDEWWKKRGL